MERTPQWTILTILVVVFGVITFILLGVDIGRGNVHSSAVLDTVASNHRDLVVIKNAVTRNLSDPLVVYRFYFKNQSQIDYIRSLEKLVHHPTNTTAQKNCEFKCTPHPAISPNKSGVVNPQPSDTNNYSIHHGCCTSVKDWVAPTRAKNVNGDWVVVVQTPSDKQYFVSEKCVQEPGCTGCTCDQPVPFIYEAIVYAKLRPIFVIGNMKVEHIQIPGCCKCLNV